MRSIQNTRAPAGAGARPMAPRGAVLPLSTGALRCIRPQPLSTCRATDRQGEVDERREAGFHHESREDLMQKGQQQSKGSTEQSQQRTGPGDQETGNTPETGSTPRTAMDDRGKGIHGDDKERRAKREQEASSSSQAAGSGSSGQQGQVGSEGIFYAGANAASGAVERNPGEVPTSDRGMPGAAPRADVGHAAGVEDVE